MLLMLARDFIEFRLTRFEHRGNRLVFDKGAIIALGASAPLALCRDLLIEVPIAFKLRSQLFKRASERELLGFKRL